MKLSAKTALAIWAVGLPAMAFAQASPSPFTTGHRFDVMGRETGTIAPDPDQSGPLAYQAMRMTYNGRGQLTKLEAGELSAWQSQDVAPSSWTGFTVLQTVDITYDSNGRKIKEQVRAGSSGPIHSVVQFSYDSIGRPECTAVRMNASAFGSAPAACTVGMSGTQGPDRITKNVYDAAGQVIQIRRAVGTSLEQAYATYSYTNNGKQEYVIDAVGNRAKLEYDGFDRQAKWIFSSTAKPASFNSSTQANALATAGLLNTGDYEQYGYDANGNRTTLKKRDGATLGYQYDALNRTTVKVVPERGGLSPTHTRDVYFGYDLLGNMTFARFDNASGEGVTNSYDGLGRLLTSSLAIDGVTRSLGNVYDADGNRTKITHPDGIAFWTCYDGLNRFDRAWWGGSVTCGGPVSGATQFANVDYNSAALRSTIGRASSYSDYVYDGTLQLSTLTQRFAGNVGNVTHSFDYNPAGQISALTTGHNDFVWTGSYNVNRNYTTNGLNQYTGAGPASFSYDANGNLVSDGSTTFIYDVENRMVGASGAKNATLRYDPLGRLYEIATPSNTTRFLNDGDHLVAEYSSSGTLLRRYFWGPGYDEPILWDEGSALNCSDTRFLSQNHQGSVIAIANCAGNRLAVNTYDEYGIPAATNQGRFQFTGQAWLSELGLSYYKARMYSPTLGRFMQTDPIGYEDQVNLYAYLGNDPINGADPTGMCDPEDDNCIHDSATASAAPSLPTIETTPQTDDIVVTGLRARSEQTSQKGVPSNDELPIVVIADKVKELVRGTDYSIDELKCKIGNDTYDMTKITISGASSAGATAAGHLHRGNRDPGPGPDDGQSVAVRRVVQYMAWGRGKDFGAGKVEFRSGAGFTYQSLGGSQPKASDVRATLGGMNRGSGSGTKAKGVKCSSR